MAKKAPPNTQTKVETLTIRVSPKMKFGLELLARKQHRNLTSVADWALYKALKDPVEGLSEGLLEEVWDPYEPDRLVKLALKCPELLTYEEELIWRIIQNDSFYWNDERDAIVTIEVIRDEWETITGVAKRKLPYSALIKMKGK